MVTDSPGGVLMAQELPPCVRAATVPVVAVTEPAPGVKVHDFGRNFTGWEKLRIKAPAGTKVTMTFAETLAPDGGRIDTLSTGVPATGVEQRDTYVCRGGGEEIWEPRFTWHFRSNDLARLEPPVVPGLDSRHVPIGACGHHDRERFHLYHR